MIPAYMDLRPARRGVAVLAAERRATPVPGRCPLRRLRRDGKSLVAHQNDIIPMSHYPQPFSPEGTAMIETAVAEAAPEHTANRGTHPSPAQRDGSAAVRAWALAHGRTEATRGRFKPDVIDAYNAAHSAGSI